LENQINQKNSISDFAIRISELEKNVIRYYGARRPLAGRKKFSPQTVPVCNDLMT